jgi:hypothetical protein
MRDSGYEIRDRSRYIPYLASRISNLKHAAAETMIEACNSPTGSTFLPKVKHFGSKSIGFGSLSRSAAKHLPSGFGGSDSGCDALPEQVSLKFRQSRHQRSNEFALRGAQVKLKTSPGNPRNVPGLEIIKGLDEVEGTASSAGELRDKNRIDHPLPCQCQELLAFGALMLRTGSHFFPDSHHLETGPLGIGPHLPFLPFTRLIRSGDPAVNGYPLSQLNLPDLSPRKAFLAATNAMYHLGYT